MQPVRLAHLSDVHIRAAPDRWRLGDWLGKRTTGFINSRLGRRGRLFRRADVIARALAADLRRAGSPDRVVFSGDASTVGLRSELARAAALLRVGSPDLDGLAVPGNHDYYTPADETSGHFEAAFGPWQRGERLDGAVYPFAQRVGPAWLVGVNSATGNRWPSDASGAVGAAQLDRLGRLLDSLTPGPRILVTHYPVARVDGRPESRSHALRDLADLIRVADRGKITLWLHGHRHEPYFLDDRKVAPFPVACAGSATQAGVWGYNEYVIDGLDLRAGRRTFDPAGGRFVDGPSFALRLPDR